MIVYTEQAVDPAILYAMDEVRRRGEMMDTPFFITPLARIQALYAAMQMPHSLPDGRVITFTQEMMGELLTRYFYPLTMPSRLPATNERNARGAVIVVSSFSGGVGKTTLALNLAFLLQRSEYKVCYVPTDLSCPLGTPEDLFTLKSWKQPIEYQKMFLKQTVEVEIPVAYLPNKLALVRGFVVSVNPVPVIKHLQGYYDYIVVDTAAGEIAETNTFLAELEMAKYVVVLGDTPQKAKEAALSLSGRGKQSSMGVVSKLDDYVPVLIERSPNTNFGELELTREPVRIPHSTAVGSATTAWKAAVMLPSGRDVLARLGVNVPVTVTSVLG